ncbi:hypothetical protein H2198_008286 [Neophaeococcomyces mojaviensis]|uniref:Uncharacterized protein n=1 Tax=Neophaeococcomyces mojaviensis TaxID=3383035 RepID=A0ACC2ZY08_9EURO|nr:hypothetical protein H2198_008286 [Knufia sp. JES_112]
MRRLRYNIAASLDGFIASPNGATDWIVEDESIDFVKLYAEFDMFVMGRKTYETLLDMGEQNPLRGKRREEMAIVSSGMRAEEHPEVTLVKEDVVRYVADLKAKDGRDIWLFGGGKLARCLLEAELVDTIEVAIMPVLLGEGVKMICDGSANEWRLKLRGIEKLKSGILMCEYDVVYSS